MFKTPTFTILSQTLSLRGTKQSQYADRLPVAGIAPLSLAMTGWKIFLEIPINTHNDVRCLPVGRQVKWKTEDGVHVL